MGRSCPPEAGPPQAEKPSLAMCWVYVLKSNKDQKFYIGSTRNLENRVNSHNKGKVRSTKARRPLALVHKEEHDSITSARQRENFLKSGQGRKWLKHKSEECQSG